MNHVYRLVWNHRRNGWVAVSELTRGKKKSSVRNLLAAAMSLAAVVAQANPTGGQVVAGTGQVGTSGNTTTVTQSSQNLSVNWQSFNIAAQETVNFVQPSASAVAVNRILGSSGTQILGHLNANGQVYLINPNGVLFGQGSQVNVGALVASTLDLNPDTPGSHSHTFSGDSTGTVVNEGTITAANGGYVALLGNRVSNSGTIVARMGSAALGAGSAVTLTFSGDSLVSIQVDRSTLNNMAANGGLIAADGGRVIMTAGARDALLASVVNNTGVVEARTVEDHAGAITLLGGMSGGQVNVGGTLDASAPNGGNGGDIETSAAHVSVANDARITTAAAMGLTGSWLVDPQDFSVAASGGDITGTALSNQLASNNIELQSSSGGTAGAGNLNVNDNIAWSANTSLTLTAANNVNVNANIAASGAAAGLVINPNSANGGDSAAGAGVFALNNGSTVTLSGAHPTLSIAGHAYTVISSIGAQGSTSGTDLQGIDGNLGGYYALGSDLDAAATSSWNSGAGFSPLGPANFTGTFDGLGHTIANLTIHRPNSQYVGLFGHLDSSGVIQNVGLDGGSMTGSQTTGGLVGENDGTISNTHATGPVAGAYWVGGLVGLNYGAIKNSYATGAVSNSSYSTGGLVGENGSYWNHGAASISNSYATGAVSATAAAVGGLAGVSYGSVSNSYATGSATSSGGNPAEVGGLIGALGDGTISNSYATGLVTAQYQVGGLIGVKIAGSVTASYWDTTTTGRGSSAGGTGLTTAQMQTASNFAGFNFTTTPGAQGNNWVMVDDNGTVNNSGGASGATRPVLASEYATTITNTHQLQLMEIALGANYSLAGDINAAATAGNNDIWLNSAGFVPIATASLTAYTGVFNGFGHAINGLVIYRPAQNSVGVFAASAGTIENLALVGGSVTGGGYWTGGLVGRNGGTVDNSHVSGSVIAGGYVGGLAGTNSGTINNSSSTASVVGYGSGNVGGLVGANYGAITGSYETGSVNAGGGRIGGLVGANFFNTTVSDSYATGAVNGGGSVGGLIGSNYGPVSRSYAAGAVTGAFQVGGLVGNNHVANSISNSMWDTTATGQSASSGGGTGLTTAQMQQQSNFAGWDFAGTWITYSGHTDPLLRSFMTPLTVTANSATQTYNGVAYSGADGASYSTTPNANLLGALTYTGASANAGSYAITPQGLYSNQQGYLISYANGTLTVNPATLTVSGTSVADKVYDGTTSASLTGGTLAGIVGSDSVTLQQIGAFASANAGTAIAVTTSDSLGGAAASNYVLTQPGGLSANITPAALTVTGTNVANRVYDGTTLASLTGGALSGVIGTDSIVLTQAGTFASANAGTGIEVTSSDSLSGASAGNYALSQPIGLSADITPATLTYSASSASVSAGKAPSGLSGTVGGFVAGENLGTATSGTLAWTTNAIASSLPGVYAIQGAGLVAANYVFTQATGNATALTVGAAPVTPPSVAWLESSILTPTGSNGSQTFSSSSNAGSPPAAINAASPATDMHAAPPGGSPSSGNSIVIDSGLDLGSKGSLSVEDRGVNLPGDSISLNQ